MSNNESLDAAVEYVCEQIDDNLRDETFIPPGSRIDVGEMCDTDCIPVMVTDRRGMLWNLVAVESVFSRHRGYDLKATYKAQ